jgi:hypothetical protein
MNTLDSLGWKEMATKLEEFDPSLWSALNDRSNYTKAGRINQSAMKRVLKASQKDLEYRLETFKLIAEDYFE